jgi:hypothetical protein
MTRSRQTKFKSALLEEKNMSTVFMDPKGVIVVKFLPLYWNAKNCEHIPASSSTHQENAINPAFP